MRALLDWYLQWHPPIMHDLHESVPFLYTFSGQAPQNPTLDPILYGELPMFANFEMAQLTKYGLPGVWTHALRRHVVARLPRLHVVEPQRPRAHVRDVRQRRRDDDEAHGRRTPDAARCGGCRDQTSARVVSAAARPTARSTWSMRNNTNFMQTGVLTRAAVHVGVSEDRPRELLSARAATRSSRARRTRRTASSFRPDRQDHDARRAAGQPAPPCRASKSAARRASSSSTDGTYPAGSFVIKRDQPYGRLAKILLEKQNFPDAELRTYDDTGWTMGLMLQTEVKPTADKAILGVEDGAGHERPEARRNAGAARTAPAPSSSRQSRRERHRHAALPAEGSDGARRRNAPSKRGRREYPAGIVHHPGDAERTTTSSRCVTKAIEPLGLDARRRAAMPDVRDARRRSAAARDVQHVGQHAGSGLGPPRVRSSSRCRSI